MLTQAKPIESKIKQLKLILSELGCLIDRTLILTVFSQ